LGLAAELRGHRLWRRHNGRPSWDAILGGTVAQAHPDPLADSRWWGNHLGELRWQLDAARLLVSPVLRGQGIPRGDGRPVLLLPGFLAGDYTLATMALWLRRAGYRSSGARFLANVSCSDEALRRVELRAETLFDEHGRRVAIVGHSRGAHLGKALAARRPELVSHVIGLGGGLSSQMAISAPTQAAVALIRAYHRRNADGRRPQCLTESCSCAFTSAYRAPFPRSVRLTSIYSEADGVVRWQSCVVPYADNVKVGGTHVGLAFNAEAYRATALALARPERELG
jgi:triacylglycerol lipase